MSYEYKALIEQAIIDDDRPLDWEEGFKELDEVYAQAAKVDECEAKNKEPLEELKYLKKVNKELLEELKYLKKVNNDLVWQRDTDEEHEAKAESYTKLVSQINAMNAIVATNYDKDMTDTNLHLLMLGAEVKRFFESGEPNAKK